MNDYAGIDYGLGLTNIDTATGIRYGIVSMNSLGEWAWEEMMHGEDLDFNEFRKAVKDSLALAIETSLAEFNLNYGNDAEEMADAIVDDLEFDNYESTGDNPRYLVESNDYHLQTTSDGKLFVFKSRWYTHAAFCSPCVPGAGDLGTPCDAGPKTYCLNSDSYSKESPCPYPVYLCATDELVYSPDQEKEED